MRTSTSSRVSAIGLAVERQIDQAVVADVGEQLGAALLAEPLFDLGQQLAELGAEQLEIGDDFVLDVERRVVAELELLYVELFFDHGGVFFEPRLMRRVGQNDFDFGERLADFEAGGAAGVAAERGDEADEIHLRGEGFVDRGGIAGGVVGEVDAFGSGSWTLS